jgi:hypothetical protein
MKVVSLQKVKLPEMIPFAIATGKIAYASWVKGSWRMKNNGGGMTSLNLQNSIRLHPTIDSRKTYRSMGR